MLKLVISRIGDRLYAHLRDIANVFVSCLEETPSDIIDIGNARKCLVHQEEKYWHRPRVSALGTFIIDVGNARNAWYTNRKSIGMDPGLLVLVLAHCEKQEQGLQKRAMHGI